MIDVKQLFWSNSPFFFNLDKASNNAIRASFVLSKMIGKSSQTFSEENFIKDFLLNASKSLCPEKRKIFESISLSPNTVASWYYFQRISHGTSRASIQYHNEAEICRGWCVPDFYQFLQCERFLKLLSLFLHIMAMKGSIYVCKELLLTITINKTALCLRLTDEHLHSMLRLVNLMITGKCCQKASSTWTVWGKSA